MLKKSFIAIPLITGLALGGCGYDADDAADVAEEFCEDLFDEDYSDVFDNFIGSQAMDFSASVIDFFSGISKDAMQEHFGYLVKRAERHGGMKSLSIDADQIKIHKTIYGQEALVLVKVTCDDESEFPIAMVLIESDGDEPLNAYDISAQKLIHKDGR